MYVNDVSLNNSEFREVGTPGTAFRTCSLHKYFQNEWQKKYQIARPLCQICCARGKFGVFLADHGATGELEPKQQIVGQRLSLLRQRWTIIEHLERAIGVKSKRAAKESLRDIGRNLSMAKKLGMYILFNREIKDIPVVSNPRHPVGSEGSDVGSSPTEIKEVTRKGLVKLTSRLLAQVNSN